MYNFWMFVPNLIWNYTMGFSVTIFLSFVMKPARRGSFPTFGKWENVWSLQAVLGRQGGLISQIFAWQEIRAEHWDIWKH